MPITFLSEIGKAKAALPEPKARIKPTITKASVLRNVAPNCDEEVWRAPLLFHVTPVPI